jgi:hypothetical protein
MSWISPQIRLTAPEVPKALRTVSLCWFLPLTTSSETSSTTQRGAFFEIHWVDVLSTVAFSLPRYRSRPKFAGVTDIGSPPLRQLLSQLELRGLSPESSGVR